ncbi:PREDICTED: kinesin-like protein KIN-14C isoform X1 [Lupinus angustifolius]|uniref:kinesin-like protein KIN-14C isoform X1 n=1 Tax=Lupinus angustifolius TaxID=3871 RepID=UPI00092F2E7B|nr:PREDICTED: kinesin-like protein KIN-14C isoform X1 [Lupinus angustifolius]
MASRNQNRPPRSPNTLQRKVGTEEIPLDKRRRIVGARGRDPFGVISNKPEDVANAEGSECSTVVVDFTSEEVEALLNQRMKKGNSYDKKEMDHRADLVKRLKLCVRWYKRVEEGYIQEKEKLRIELQSAEKKCIDTETEMKNKIEELNETITNLRMTISSLEERIAKEESDKLEAIDCYRKEKEARSVAEKLQACLSTELEKVRDEKSAAERKAISNEDLYKRSQEYNMSLQQYNSRLQSDLETTNEAHKRLETEKATIVENLSNVRAHNKALQDQLSSLKASQDDITKQKEMLVNDTSCLREELKQIRDDRDRQLGQVQTLAEEVSKYKEYTGKSVAQLDTLTIKTNALEETCSYQREEILKLQQQLIAEKEKSKMANLSASETRIVFEDQQRTIHELQERLADKEFQVIEGEKLRKKLHNTILELKGNIRVFCRVRPLLPDDATGMDMVVSYPTSTEAHGQSIDLIQSGQKYPFTFDKVFNHDASQQDVFTEISQLVQSALDGYKVCIFAYGQTGSGKTYTMMGRPDAPDLKGLIPRSLEQIFQISQSLKNQGWKYKMQASILEIYNETIRDLLANRSSGIDPTRTENGVPGKQYTIKHDANGNTHVTDLTVVDVCSVNEISSLLQKAAQSRSVGRTQMNEQSSRSHFVFTLRICGTNENTEQQVQGVLNLIDLAGSERLSRSGATGDRLKETQAINKSLSSLSDVIFALARKEEHVPFRNSKLTYLLQPCLGGDSKTLMFVNISPDPSSTGESLCSLRFAARVNACEIGIPRRQTSTKSFDSSRLSYG